MRACIGLRRGALIMHWHLRLFQSRLYCSCFSRQFLRVNWVPTFFSCFHGRADSCVYKLLLSFRLDTMHLP